MQHPLVRPSFIQVAAVVPTSLIIAAATKGEASLLGWHLPLAAAIAALTVPLVWKQTACFCDHQAYQHIVVLDANLKMEFDELASNSVSFFKERRETAQKAWRKLTAELESTKRYVKHFAAGLKSSAIAAFGAAIAVFPLTALVNAILTCVFLTGVGVLLWRCGCRITREYSNPGPEGSKQTKLEEDISQFNGQYEELLLGVRRSQTNGRGP